MSSLIAKQVNTNMSLISLKLFNIYTTYVPLFEFIGYNSNYNYNSMSDTTIRYSAYNLFVSANLYLLDSHNLRTRNLSHHNADWITSALTDHFHLSF